MISPKKIKPHQAPKDIPCLLLGQLAVDALWHGQGIGAGLVKDALTREISVAGQAGMRAVVFNALDEGQVNFGLVWDSLQPKEIRIHSSGAWMTCGRRWPHQLRDHGSMLRNKLLQRHEPIICFVRPLIWNSEQFIRERACVRPQSCSASH
jgi:hypothetical protein